MTAPVEHWATDFDITDRTYQTDPYPIWNELRETCPVATSHRRGTNHLPTTWETIKEVAHDTERFSSRDVGVLPPPAGVTNLLEAPPITSDPPFHTDARRILLPHFSPKAVVKLESATRSICSELVDAIGDAPTADAAGDYAQHIPVRVITHMLGIPESDEAMFTDWAIDIFQRVADDPEIGRNATRSILQYFAGVIEDRRAAPGDDLISELILADLDGAPLTNRHIGGTCFLLLMAGIDTTWSSIGASLWHLATHPDDRDRLVAEPDLLPIAIEELLRAYAPVTMGRIANVDTEVGGCPISAGDRMLLAFPSGNRDPEHFDRPDEVVIDRLRNRHFAFGIGIHRCIGSNLARMELRVALATWLARFPTFRLDPDIEVFWSGTQVRGPRQVPVLLP
ncbi:MAG: cytochrome P450 [Acidimicrobiales bacterium]